MLVYYSYFGRARAAKIAEIQGIVAELEEAARRRRRSANASRRSRPRAGRNSRRSMPRATSAAARSRRMNAQIKTRNDSIAKLKREAAALEKLIADLRRAMSDLPPTGGQAFEKVRGRLDWPVAGKIVARFGQSRGGGLKWNGVMIEAARGTAVRALYGGRVAYADWLPGMGLLVIVDHGGYMSLYAHNEQLYKAAGDRVGAAMRSRRSATAGGAACPACTSKFAVGPRP